MDYKTETPLGSMDPAEAYEKVTEDLTLITEVEERYEQSRTGTTMWREQAKVCFDFVAGNQWLAEDLEKLREYNRPDITFNFTGPTIDTITGLEIANRQDTMYFPRNPGNAIPSEVLSATAKWVRDETDANDEESEAFHDMAVCGVGWTETWVNYDEDPDGKICINRIDPFEIYVDPDSKMKNFSDARFLIRIKDVSRKWLTTIWPSKADEIAASKMWVATEDDSLKIENRKPPSDSYKKSGQKGTGPKTTGDDMVRLLEYQYVKYETYVRVRDPYNGSIVELEPDKFLVLHERFTAMGIQVQFIRQVRKKYCRAFICGDVVLEKGECPCPYSFSYKAMTGKRDRNNNYWYGVVRSMIDPQKWANKWLAQALHIVNSNAQGGVMIEDGAVEDPRDFEDSWTDPSAITWVPDGTLQNQRIQPKPSPQYPAAMESLTQFAIAAIPKVTGLNVELLGMANREQPAELEYQRRQAGVTILNALFNSQSRYRKEHGRLLLYMINRYISDGRLARVNIQGMDQYIPIIRNPDTIKYDIVVGESPSSTNVKERTWVILEKMIPMMLQVGVPLIPEILDYVPLPATLISKMKEAQAKQQQEKAAQEKAVQQQQLMALLRQQLAAASKDEASAEKERAQAREAAAQANIAASPLGVIEKILELYNMKATADKTVSETPVAPPFDVSGILPFATDVQRLQPSPMGQVPQFPQPVGGMPNGQPQPLPQANQGPSQAPQGPPSPPSGPQGGQQQGPIQFPQGPKPNGLF